MLLGMAVARSTIRLQIGAPSSPGVFFAILFIPDLPSALTDSESWRAAGSLRTPVSHARVACG